MTFKKIALGLAIFILTIVFIVFVNQTINPKPTYKTCSSYPYGTSYYNGGYNTCYNSYQSNMDNYREKSFLIVSALSILAIIAGVLVKSVAPVSWGLGLAGVVMIIYVFIASYPDIDKPYRAIISGLAFVILIWIAYAKLGDKEAIQSNQSQNQLDDEKI